MRDAWEDEEFALRWDSADSLRTNPDRLNQLELLVALVQQRYRDEDCILDLGAGSGLVEEVLLQRMPGARVLGIDHSPAMLALARRRHAGSPQVQFRELAFAALPGAELDAAPFRFILCVQALHEVEHTAKQQVFAEARRLISEDGRLLVLDRFTYDHENFKAEYRAVWQRMNRAVELAEPIDYDEYHARYSNKSDHVAGVDDYLKWMREEGFTAECLYRQFNRALLCARPATGTVPLHR